MKRYVTILYHSILLLFLNEFGPVNWEEMVFLYFAMLLGVMMNTLVFSNIVMLISSISEKERKI